MVKFRARDIPRPTVGLVMDWVQGSTLQIEKLRLIEAKGHIRTAELDSRVAITILSPASG